MTKLKEVVSSVNAPEAIGTYSQGIKVGDFVWLSGQIPLDPSTMTIVGSDRGNVDAQIRQVFMNLRSVCEASGGSLDNVIKLNIYLINMDFFSRVNEIMTEFFCEPFPARAAVGVSSLPKGALIEAEAVLFLGN